MESMKNEKLKFSPASTRTPFSVLVFYLAWAGVASASEQLALPEPVCKIPALERSDRIIRAILDDLAASYSEVGGGGIGEIRQIETDVFRISLPQEERVDLLTYAIKIDSKCAVTFLKKEVSAFTP